MFTMMRATLNKWRGMDLPTRIFAVLSGLAAIGWITCFVALAAIGLYETQIVPLESHFAEFGEQLRVAEPFLLMGVGGLTIVIGALYVAGRAIRKTWSWVSS